jgi:enoyl-CoA hydratase/carnithine racemase
VLPGGIETHRPSSVPSMDGLHLARTGARATLTLDQARTKNAITAPMWAGVRDHLLELAADDSVRVVVITGANGEFCSGADVGPSQDRTDRRGVAAMAVVNQAAQALHDLPVPSIARVDGVAAGAGLNLALGCDLVVASDRARFSEIFARRSLSLDFGGSWLLPRLVGMHKAKELALLADIISADEAARIGLVNRVVPLADLDAAVDEWADRLEAGPPIALAASKSLLNNSIGRTFAEALHAEANAQALNFTTDDVVEAMAAWIDKRDPTFVGR